MFWGFFFQIDDISSLLNITSTLNADGKTERYYFKIESTSFSKDVKEIKLTFIVGQILRTLTIKVKGKIISLIYKIKLIICFLRKSFKTYADSVKWLFLFKITHLKRIHFENTSLSF